MMVRAPLALCLLLCAGVIAEIPSPLRIGTLLPLKANYSYDVSTKTFTNVTYPPARLFDFLYRWYREHGAMELAIRRINANTTLLPDHNLTLAMGETGGEGLVALEQAYAWMDDPSVVGMICYDVDECHRAANIADLKRSPVLAPYASFEVDSMTDGPFPFTINLTPTIPSEAQPLIALCKAMNWTRVAFFEEDVDQLWLLNALVREGAAEGVEISIYRYGLTEGFPFTVLDENDLEQRITSARAADHTIFITYFGVLRSIDTIAVFERMGILGDPRYAVLGIGPWQDAWGDLKGNMSLLDGYLQVRKNLDSEFKQLADDVKEMAIELHEYSGEDDQAYLITLSYAYDAIFTYARALHELIYTQGVTEMDGFGIRLRETILQQEFDGIVDHVSFNEWGQRQIDYDILNCHCDEAIFDSAKTCNVTCGRYAIWDHDKNRLVDETRSTIDAFQTPPFFAKLSTEIPLDYTPLVWSGSYDWKVVSGDVAWSIAMVAIGIWTCLLMVEQAVSAMRRGHSTWPWIALACLALALAGVWVGTYVSIGAVQFDDDVNGLYFEMQYNKVLFVVCALVGVVGCAIGLGVATKQWMIVMKQLHDQMKLGGDEEHSISDASSSSPGSSSPSSASFEEMMPPLRNTPKLVFFGGLLVGAGLGLMQMLALHSIDLVFEYKNDAWVDIVVIVLNVVLGVVTTYALVRLANDSVVSRFLASLALGAAYIGILWLGLGQMELFERDPATLDLGSPIAASSINVALAVGAAALCFVFVGITHHETKEARDSLDMKVLRIRTRMLRMERRFKRRQEEWNRDQKYNADLINLTRPIHDSELLVTLLTNIQKDLGQRREIRNRRARKDKANRMASAPVSMSGNNSTSLPVVYGMSDGVAGVEMTPGATRNASLSESTNRYDSISRTTSRHGSRISQSGSDNENSASNNSGSDDHFKLEDCMKNTVTCEYIKDFASKNNFVELVMFWLSVQRFKSLKDKRIVKRTATSIYSKYLTAGAPSKINISATMLKDVADGVKKNNVLASAFDECQTEVLNLLQTNIMPQFQSSESGRMCRNILQVAALRSLNTNDGDDEDDDAAPTTEENIQLRTNQV